MPKYRVILWYSGSETYELEATDEDAAVAEANQRSENGTDEELRNRIDLEFIDAAAYKVKEEGEV